MIDPNNLRKIGIGGSEVAALFDADEYRDQFSVWASKKGGLKRGDEPPNIRMVVGKALEQGVLELYTYVTGRKIQYCDETFQHPERPYQIYTPDAFCVGERRGVDAKVVFWDQRRKWGLDADQIPMRVQLQAFWYMSALDYDLWDICALVGEGEPRVYTIHRDREAERVMLARVEEWYQRYLVGNDRPPIGSSEEASRWLQQTYPAHKRPDLRWAVPEEIEILERYVQVRLAQKALSAEQDALETQIKDAIKDREGLQWDEGIFTWRKTKDGVKVDYKSMAIGLLHAVKDPEARAELLALYTTPKPGTRRIRIDHDALRSQQQETEEATV
jgi:predicted phage-related endonuclease